MEIKHQQKLQRNAVVQVPQTGTKRRKEAQIKEDPTKIPPTPTPPPRKRMAAKESDRNRGSGNPPANQADGTSNIPSDIAHLWICLGPYQDKTPQRLPAPGINATLVLL
jgi:hypothetical protein